MLELYKNIKERRISLGLTQSDLAAKMGYADKSMIAKIEKGTVDLPQSKIVAFAEALNTTPSQLMGWENDWSDESAAIDALIAKDRMFKRMYAYWKTLSDLGKKKALDNVEDLAKIYNNCSLDNLELINESYPKK